MKNWTDPICFTFERRGGDIDILLLSDRIDFRGELQIKREILDSIGWQKLDLLVERKDKPLRPIAQIARSTGIELWFFL